MGTVGKLVLGMMGRLRPTPVLGDAAPTISLPPVDGLFFYDVGLAWSSGQKVSFDYSSARDITTTRTPLRSYGAGIRLNLFGFALLRWDYAIALDRPNGKKGYWSWTLGPSF